MVTILERRYLHRCESCGWWAWEWITIPALGGVIRASYLRHLDGQPFAADAPAECDTCGDTLPILEVRHIDAVDIPESMDHSLKGVPGAL